MLTVTTCETLYSEVHRREEFTREECSVQSICLKNHLLNEVLIITAEKWSNTRNRRRGETEEQQKYKEKDSFSGENHEQRRLTLLWTFVSPQLVFLLGLLLNSLHMNWSGVCYRTGSVNICYILVCRCLSLYMPASPLPTSFSFRENVGSMREWRRVVGTKKEFQKFLKCIKTDYFPFYFM